MSSSEIPHSAVGPHSRVVSEWIQNQLSELKPQASRRPVPASRDTSTSSDFGPRSFKRKPRHPWQNSEIATGRSMIRFTPPPLPARIRPQIPLRALDIETEMLWAPSNPSRLIYVLRSHHAEFDTTKLCSSMFPSNDIPLPHFSCRGPVNFLRWSLPERIRQRIVSKLPRLHLTLFQNIPHPRDRPLVRSICQKLIAFSYLSLGFQYPSVSRSIQTILPTLARVTRPRLD